MSKTSCLLVSTVQTLICNDCSSQRAIMLFCFVNCFIVVCFKVTHSFCPSVDVIQLFICFDFISFNSWKCTMLIMVTTNSIFNLKYQYFIGFGMCVAAITVYVVWVKFIKICCSMATHHITSYMCGLYVNYIL